MVVEASESQRPMAENGSSSGDAVAGGRNPIVPVDISVALAGSVYFVANSAANNTAWLWTAICAVLLGALLVLLKYRSRMVPVMQTNSGNIVAAKTPLSRKQAITIIKNSALTPSDDVYDSIKKRIDDL